MCSVGTRYGTALARALRLLIVARSGCLVAYAYASEQQQRSSQQRSAASDPRAPQTAGCPARLRPQMHRE
eukprot:6211079-Pleurochrysis_carterae.AAC.1